MREIQGKIEYDERERKVITIFADGKEINVLRAVELVPLAPDLGWGSCERNVQQLAVAILLDITKDVNFVKTYFIDYTQEVLSQIPANVSWTITEAEIASWCESKGWKYGKSKR